MNISQLICFITRNLPISLFLGTVVLVIFIFFFRKLLKDSWPIFLIGSIGILFAVIALVNGESINGLLLNMGSEFLGAIIIYLLLEKIISEKEKKTELRFSLIRDLHSDEKGIRDMALEELKIRNWLNEMDMKKVVLQGSNLENEDLHSSNLSGANLFGVNLRSANLKKTILRNANLRGSQLINSTLIESNLEGADFSGAFLTGAKLSRANLSGAAFTGANLENADLSMAIIDHETDFNNANLRGAIIIGLDKQELINRGAKFED